MEDRSRKNIADFENKIVFLSQYEGEKRGDYELLEDFYIYRYVDSGSDLVYKDSRYIDHLYVEKPENYESRTSIIEEYIRSNGTKSYGVRFREEKYLTTSQKEDLHEQIELYRKFYLEERNKYEKLNKQRQDRLIQIERLYAKSLNYIRSKGICISLDDFSDTALDTLEKINFDIEFIEKNYNYNGYYDYKNNVDWYYVSAYYRKIKEARKVEEEAKKADAREKKIAMLNENRRKKEQGIDIEFLLFYGALVFTAFILTIITL